MSKALSVKRHQSNPRDEWAVRIACPACRRPDASLAIAAGRADCDSCEAQFDAPAFGGQRVLGLTTPPALPSTCDPRQLEALAAQWNSSNSADDVLRDEVHRLAPGHRAGYMLTFGARNAQLAYDLDRDLDSEQSALMDPDVELLGNVAQLVRGDRLEPLAVQLRSQRVPLNAHKLVLIAGRAEYLPLMQSSIDTLVTPGLLDHSTDLRAFAAQAARVLEPGGTWIHAGALAFSRLPLPSPELVRHTLAEAGFECVRMRFRREHPRGGLHRLPSFAARLTVRSRQTVLHSV